MKQAKATVCWPKVEEVNTCFIEEAGVLAKTFTLMMGPGIEIFFLHLYLMSFRFLSGIELQWPEIY